VVISELAAARAELLHAAARPLEGDARDAWIEAEEALAVAEAGAAHPGAEDAAYVALRLSQRARLATLYVAEHEALVKARATVRRLGDDDERRLAFLAALDQDRRAAVEERRRIHEVHRAALSASGVGGVILDRPEGLLLRIPADDIFLPGTSLLRSGAEERLAALAAVLGAGSSKGSLCLVMLDDVEGTRTDAAVLAVRRRERVMESLTARGVPADAFVTPPRLPPPGTEVDVLWMEGPPAGPGS
jgi:hypothetical protein